MNISEDRKFNDIIHINMTSSEAQKIINEYLKSGGREQGCYPISDLPHSQGKIKYAHFLLAEYLISRNLYTTEIHRNLSISYSEIDKFFDEDSDCLNAQHEAYLSNLKMGIAGVDPWNAKHKKALNDEIEFNNFVVDCHGDWNKKKEN